MKEEEEKTLHNCKPNCKLQILVSLYVEHVCVIRLSLGTRESIITLQIAVQYMKTV